MTDNSEKARLSYMTDPGFQFDPGPIEGRPAKYDAEEIDGLLRADVETLVCHLVGASPNRALSTRSQARWGSKGGLAADTGGPNQGRITRFDGDGRGRSPITFIMEELACDFPSALEWASGWLGLAAKVSSVDTAAIHALQKRRTVEQAKRDEAASREELRRVQKARRLYEASRPVEGTPAASYLAGRGITCALPDCVRYSPHATNGYPALLVAATDPEGTVKAVQRVFVTEDGEKAPVTPRKQTNGVTAGAAVRLPGDVHGPLYLNEGPENGLSVWWATGGEVWVALGSIGKLVDHVPADRKIVIARDGDAPGSQASNALEKAVAKLLERGCDVWVTAPPKGLDANDILRKDGMKALQHHLSNAHALQPAAAKYEPPTMTLTEAEEAVRNAFDRFVKGASEYWGGDLAG